ncbi:hypothetical protein [Streptomyces sp. URMC 129]|uniref:hypothetical protein n=1 Tax=Streptomyces sp. URMC 129 TaxID=3423407 RepID=UPI003F1D1241
MPVPVFSRVTVTRWARFPPVWPMAYASGGHASAAETVISVPLSKTGVSPACCSSSPSCPGLSSSVPAPPARAPARVRGPSRGPEGTTALDGIRGLLSTGRYARAVPGMGRPACGFTAERGPYDPVVARLRVTSSSACGSWAMCAERLPRQDSNLE